jgi:hypothetical protein
VETSNANNPASAGQPAGTIKVFLADPRTGVAADPVRRSLVFLGVDDDDRVTFGPVTLAYAAVQTLGDVAASTTRLVVRDPATPGALAVARVTVQAGRTAHVSDVALQPARPALLAALGLPPGGAPVAVGAGFVQTRPGEVGEPGANHGMAGAYATSATADLPFPYKTNSWLSPILYADNRSGVWTGGGPQPGTYDANGNPKVLYQLPVYPHPWVLHYNTQQPSPVGRATPAIVPGFAPITGLKLIAEIPTFAAGTNVPAAAGGNRSETYGEFNTVPGVLDMITVDPGFLAGRIKVARMGDYDADLVLRAVDADDFEATGLPQQAGLQLGVVRGNPLLFFTAHALPKVDFYHTTSNVVGALGGTHGVVDVAGRAIAYVVWTASYGVGDFSVGRTTALFYPDGAATYTQDAPVQNAGAGGDGRNSVRATLSFADGAGDNFFTIVDLPGAAAADAATLARLARAAFSQPTGTTVAYHYDPATQTVDVTYALSTRSALGLPEAGISGLLPHHYQASAVHDGDPVLVGAPAPLVGGGGVIRYPLTQGELHLYDTATWTCRYPVPGILPFLPPLDAADAAGRAALADYVRNGFVGKWSGAIPPYTNQNAVKGSQSYQIAKFVQRNMLALPAIDQSPDGAALSAQVFAATRAVIELYFRQSPTQTAEQAGSAPYYTYYDPRVGSLYQYPQAQPPANPNFPADAAVAPHEAFGATSRTNDHQFHYGYFVHAAAQIAIRDPQWGAAWRDAINQLVFDAANTAEVNPKPLLAFPRMRSWDAYMNHSYSAGLSWPDLYGNNEESISEELNFWAGTSLWGAVTGQDAILQHGLSHFAAAVHSAYMYWFDIAGNKRALADTVKGATLRWPGGQGAAIVTDGHTGLNTFFNAHPTAARVIIVLPVGPHSWWLAMNPTFTAKSVADYRQYLKDYDIDPLAPAVGKDKHGGPFSVKNPWLNTLGYCSQLAKWMAMVDPADAISALFPAPNDRDVVFNGEGDDTIPIDMLTDEGDTAALTWHMTRFMQTHGTPNLWVKAKNTPFAVVFDDAARKQRTYVGFNPTAAALDVAFSDGATLAQVPARAVGVTTRALP